MLELSEVWSQECSISDFGRGEARIFLSRINSVALKVIIKSWSMLLHAIEYIVLNIVLMWFNNFNMISSILYSILSVLNGSVGNRSSVIFCGLS